MLLEVLLVLPIYLFIWYVLIKYKDLIKAMSSLDSLLPKLTDEGFDDISEEGGDAQCKKRETLKDAIQYGKAHLLPGKKGKWSTAEIDRKTDEEVEKVIQHIHATADRSSKVK